MAYITGDRYSRCLFPDSIEAYVSEEDPVRVYNAFIDQLDFKKLGISLEEEGIIGAPSYNPISMLKLLVYGYSYGFRSSRKLERACYHNLSFIWLLEGLKPDHKTISEFRKKNKGALCNVLKYCARLCIDWGLIKGNTLFVDGSKMRANASLDQSWTFERCEKWLKDIDKRIDDLLNECEKIDKEEADDESLVKLRKDIWNQEELRKKVKAIEDELEEKERKQNATEKPGKKIKRGGKGEKAPTSINLTDKDCVKSLGRQGVHASYNAQIVTDGENGLIVSSDVVSQSNDTNQFANQIEQAESVIGKKSVIACADAGYWQLEDLKKISEREEETQVVVPSRKQARKQKATKFEKENFIYDQEKDEYICPEGNRLSRFMINEKTNAVEYKIKPKGICIKCQQFGKCTQSRFGRGISRLFNEELKEKLEKLYSSEGGRKIFRLRKQKVELPFGHIKRNLGAGHFLLRGREGVNAEMSLLATSFNISRMITLLGVSGIVSLLMRS